jgi:hypothetical protein
MGMFLGSAAEMAGAKGPGAARIVPNCHATLAENVEVASSGGN